MKPLILLTFAATLLGADRAQELADLEKILPFPRVPATGRISAQDRTWADWVKRTGALPPDFDSLPSITALPEPRLTTRAAWPAERQRIRALFEQYVFGHMPPAPDNLRAVITGTHDENGVTVRDVRLEFGPDHRATLRLQLLIPPGKGPFPVFLTNHPRHRPWVATAVRRGYIGCIYFAADRMYGNTDDSDAFLDVYPDYDFSCLARWAWAGMRAVDYLYTVPQVDRAKIAIAGHSRNGKQALLAAAFDDRIAAVIASSGLTGEANPWRYTTDIFFNESIERITGENPHWFLPSLRFFAGREDKLPVDQNMLMDLVAPRALYLYSGYAESLGSPLGVEQAYRSASKVYKFFGAENKIWMNLRDGEHMTTAGDIENFVDFLDTVFGRKIFPKVETWIKGYSFDDWKRTSGESIDPLRYPRRTPGDCRETKPQIQQEIQWMLGEEPPGVRFPARATLGGELYTNNGWLYGLFQRPLTSAAWKSASVSFGDDLQGDFYYPAKTPPGRKLPVVLLLHPFSYATGYSRYGRAPITALIKRGYAVFAFDQIGFGTRVKDARDFYRRYPKWSLLGKMVADTRAAVDAAAALDMVDADRIYVVGYALGAKVGLIAATMEPRIRAVAAVDGFDPLRLDTKDKGVEGIRQYSDLHGLAPRLSFFIGYEDRLPIDFDEILSLLAPRPVLIVAPTLDRYARVADVRREVEAARTRSSSITLETPLDFDRFPLQTQEAVFDWFDKAR